MPLPPDLSKPVFSINPEWADRVIRSQCVTCVKPVGEFKNDISRKEYGISGMCQQCQDDTFGEPDWDDVEEMFE